MKLAEALILRADIQTRITELRERLRESAIIQEGTQPPESPQHLLQQLDDLIQQLVELIFRINQTNIQTLLQDGRSLTEALAERDGIKLRTSILKSIASNAANRRDNYRYTHSEIRTIPTVNIAELRRDSDLYAQRFRELNIIIQAQNWQTDLI